MNRHLFPISISLLFLLFSSPVFAQATPQTLSYVESSTGLSLQLEAGRTELEFADLNADGNPDLISVGDHGNPLINSQEHGIMVWFGDGAGSWTLSQTGELGYGGIAVGDVNGDRLLDIGYGIHHNNSGTDLGDQILEVALGDGTGTSWTPWDDGLATNGESWGMFGSDFADVDHDGDLDLGSIGFGCCSGVHIYLNQKNGSWVQAFGILSGNSDQEFEFGEVNGDGNPDFAASWEEGTVYLGDGTGNFTPGDGNLPKNSFGNPSPSLGDVNDDGRDEVAFINKRNGIDVWSWVSAGVWQEISGSLPDQGGYSAVRIFDMNRDGHGDILGYGQRWVRIWAGDGMGGWTEIAAFQLPASPGDYTALRVGGDADHNGYPDIAIIVDEGSWINSRNKLHFYKEASVPSALAIHPVQPRGGETFRAGSVIFLDWLSAVPAGFGVGNVKIEGSLSGPTGPWRVLANKLPNNGRYQWRIPPNAPATTNAYLRYTLITPGGRITAVTPAAFNIVR